MKFKPNYFNTQDARLSYITRKNGKKFKIRENKLRFFFPDEWMAFYDTLKPKQKITFNFLVNTGARISEVSNVKVQDIDFDRKSIIFKFTKSRNKDGTRKIRVIGISSQFAKALRKIISDNDLKLEDNFPIHSIPAANIALHKALDKIKIKDKENISVHSVRKTLIVWLMALGVDSLKIAKHHGHTLAVLEKYYVSPDTFSFEDKQMMRQVIGDLYQHHESY